MAWIGELWTEVWHLVPLVMSVPSKNKQPQLWRAYGHTHMGVMGLSHRPTSPCPFITGPPNCCVNYLPLDHFPCLFFQRLSGCFSPLFLSLVGKVLQISGKGHAVEKKGVLRTDVALWQSPPGCDLKGALCMPTPAGLTAGQVGQIIHSSADISVSKY